MIGFFCVAPEFPSRAGKLVSEFTKKENAGYHKEVGVAVERGRILHMRIDAKWRKTKTRRPTTVCGEGVPTYLIAEIAYGAQSYTKNPNFDVLGPCDTEEDTEIQKVAEAVFSYFENVPAIPVVVVMRDEHALRRLIQHMTRGNCPTIEWNRETIIIAQFNGMRLAENLEILP